MKKINLIFLFITISAFSSCGTNNEENIPEPPETENEIILTTEATTITSEAALETAQTFWRYFSTGNVMEASQMFSLTMLEALGGLEETVYLLDQTYQNLIMASGNFDDESFFLMDYEYVDDLHAMFFMVNQASAFVTLQIVADNQGAIDGFWIVDVEFLGEDHESEYYTSEHIVLGTRWPLDGIITMPNEASTSNLVPGVVLVHGSGNTAGDMDSSLFQNRPFFDIASYLSSHGIAVLRYHKRTFSYAFEVMEEYGEALTVVQETIEDAVLAAEMLRANPMVDNNRIFMLGLSMGGMLAPRIHLSGGDFAGLILMGASPQTFGEVIVAQNIAMIETIEDEEMYTMLMEQIHEMVELFEALQHMPAAEAQAIPFDGGASLYYLRDFDAHPFYQLVQDIHIPFLIQHGSNDFQAPAYAVIPAFEEIFAGRDNVTIHTYSGLNHVLMESVATGIHDIHEDYAIPGSVAEVVLRDMVDWILVN